jgi:hypothetical protein
MDWQNYKALCSNLCSTIESVMGVWVFKETELVASHVKQGFPNASQAEQKKMFVQAHLMIGMAASNAMYGKPNYVSVSFEHADCYLFPINDEGKDFVLAVACVKPYSVDTIARAVSVMVAL